MTGAKCFALGYGVLFIVTSLPSSYAAAGDRGIDERAAGRYFEEARLACARDDGRLWGVSLCGAMLFMDPQSRAVVANQADGGGALEERNGVFVGSFPKDRNFANTATRWSGTDWATMVWPLAQEKRARVRLMMHESWHRIQGAAVARRKGSGASGAGSDSNAHLDTRDGRILLQLEWRALEAALRSDGSKCREGVEDALTFRAYRRSLFPNAATAEAALELNEGLAEYTGVKLSTVSRREAIEDAVSGLWGGPQRETFMRSFAYASGPAYGLLLDAVVPDWREGVAEGDDLGLLLAKAFSISAPVALKEAVAARSGRYDGVPLAEAETRRDVVRQERLAKDRARFVEGPVLIIRLSQPNVQFNPGNLRPLEDLGTVYPTMTLKDRWGTLTVSDGALLNTTWSEVRVPAPTVAVGRPVRGEGWTLELKPGWIVAPGARKGDFRLGRSRG